MKKFLRPTSLLIIISLLSILISGCGSSSQQLQSGEEDPLLAGFKAVKVIDFSGYSYDDVFKWAEDNGSADILHTSFEYNDDTPAGILISQEPAAGASIEDLIYVTFSLGKQPLLTSPATFTVPKLDGRALSDAVLRLTSIGFCPKTVPVYNDAVPSGTVISSSPNAGDKLEKGAIVTVYYSAGAAEDIQVPMVIGEKLTDAERLLAVKGFSIGNITYTDSDKVKDTVLLTDPLPGVAVSKDAKINIVCASGEKAEKSLALPITFADFGVKNGDVAVKVYINGELDKSKIKTLDAAAGEISFTFKGRTGVQKIAVSVNDSYKYYDIVFDLGIIKETKA